MEAVSGGYSDERGGDFDGVEVVVGVKDERISIAFFKNSRVYGYFQEEAGVRTGDIYRGRVTGISVGLKAAFAEIADNTFVYIEDSGECKAGNSVTLQIKRQAYDEKYALATRKLSVAGNYAVIYTDSDKIGVSKNITDASKKNMLKEIARKCSDGRFGVIIRTAAEEASGESVEEEIVYLIKKLAGIIDKGAESGGVKLLYKETDFLCKILRDRLTPNIDKIIIQGTEIYEEAEKYFSKNMSHYIEKLRLFNGDYNIFDLYNLDAELRKAMSRKVRLKSGAYIVIDQTEAMTVVDVNSGQYDGKADYDTMVRRINFEAAEEIARILQVRNTGGIIIIDFLKMGSDSGKDELLGCFKEFLKNDKGYPVIEGMTKLGLVEMTRRRI